MKQFCALVLMFCAAVVCAAQVPATNHVFLIVEENHSYSSVIGNTGMPYFNGLANKYGVATQYYGNTHPSIGNYFMMTAGQIYTNNDSFTSTINIDNIVRHLMAAGKTWKSYAESIPYAGYTGGNSGYYVKRHNPFAYFSDVANSSAERLNLVGIPQLLNDLTNNALPNLSYIVPNIMDDAHNGTLAQADKWLSTYVPKILASPAFQNGGVLIITFDESFNTDTAYGGGHIATLVISPKSKGGYKTAVHYQHQNLLKSMLVALGANTNLGAAASAAPMADFFAGVNIKSPTTGTTCGSPVNVSASATAGVGKTISSMRVYVDSKTMSTVSASSINQYISMTTGTHKVTVVAWDNTGASYTKSVSVNVK